MILSPLVLGLGVIAFLLWTNHAAIRAGQGHLHSDPDEISSDHVGLVFGCSPSFQGRENLYFRFRIEAAAKLWKSGKLRCLIVSGDNRFKNYNEPDAMREALIKAGVPEDKIVCDYAGLRTLDSVVRAKKVFGADRILLISQRFQNERAAYIARANGLEYVGYNARDVAGHYARKIRIRELGARAKMWLDINVLRTQPRHLGPQEILPD